MHEVCQCSGVRSGLGPWGTGEQGGVAEEFLWRGFLSEGRVTIPACGRRRSWQRCERGDDMTRRSASRQAAALAQARARRRELDRGRDERDRRVEQATAEALPLLAGRAAEKTCGYHR